MLLRLRKLQFGLRSLLWLVTAIAVALAACGWLHRRFSDQWLALQEIRASAVPFKIPDDIAGEDADLLPMSQPVVKATWHPWRPFGMTLDPLGDHYVEVTELEAKGDAPVWMAVQRLGRLRGLRRLTLQGDSASDEALTSLATSNRLKQLEVSSHSMDGSFLQALSPNTKLVRLSLSSYRLPEKTLARICQFESLEELDLSGVKIKDAATMRGLRNLRKLRDIDLSGSFPEEGLDALAQLQHLEDVRVGSYTLTNDGVRRLAASKSIVSLAIHADGNNIDDDIIDDLAAMPELLLVSLHNTKVTSAGIERLKRLCPDLEATIYPEPR